MKLWKTHHKRSLGVARIQSSPPVFQGRFVRIPYLAGPLHTVEGDDPPPLDASDPRFGTGLRDHVLEVASNGCVSCPRCGLWLSPGEFAGHFDPPPCLSKPFSVSQARRPSARRLNAAWLRRMLRTFVGGAR